MKKLLLLILLCMLSACAAPDVGPEQRLPESGYVFYTGTDDLAGDLYIGITDLEHADSGKLVVLVPMVHTGDADFFRLVQEELDRADVVAFAEAGRIVAEGRHGELLRSVPAYRGTVARGRV